MDNKKMKRFGVLVICLALSLGAMARGGGGGGHGGGGHASGHASGEGGHGGEGESTGGHSEEESSSTGGRVIIIPHGSNTSGVCQNGVDSTQDITASETQVQCKSDPSHVTGELVFGGVLLFILVMVIAILTA